MPSTPHETYHTQETVDQHHNQEDSLHCFACSLGVPADFIHSRKPKTFIAVPPKTAAIRDGRFIGHSCAGFTLHAYWIVYSGQQPSFAKSIKLNNQPLQTTTNQICIDQYISNKNDQKVTLI